MSILLLNKEKNMTSFSAIKEAQKELGFSKAGHGGTLDPLATGVLPIFFDQSTKFLQFFNSETKEYIADFIFGISSNTEDITGILTYEKAKKEPKESEIKSALKKFEGITEQIPPKFSVRALASDLLIFSKPPVNITFVLLSFPFIFVSLKSSIFNFVINF